MQRRPDLLDASIRNLPICIDSAAPATQNCVTKMSTVLYHSDQDTRTLATSPGFIGRFNYEFTNFHRFGSTCNPKRSDQNEHRFVPLHATGWPAVLVASLGIGNFQCSWESAAWQQPLNLGGVKPLPGGAGDGQSSPETYGCARYGPSSPRAFF